MNYMRKGEVKTKGLGFFAVHDHHSSSWVGENDDATFDDGNGCTSWPLPGGDPFSKPQKPREESDGPFLNIKQKHNFRLWQSIECFSYDRNVKSQVET